MDYEVMGSGAGHYEVMGSGGHYEVMERGNGLQSNGAGVLQKQCRKKLLDIFLFCNYKSTRSFFL